ncbi:sensor histidine kinase [Chryseolinea lacunae]|uniref:histidine kinase n=1 Tax=Chryseolinea lacunae TaxID=2801331 RepID=A0ABS1L4I0_9BACT|nr:HAMP domain-containing sensor histidine kinase [Chryseolinea lacunae]MBL0745822.1 HAMP domain-containing histidine kinase [Chryseolinea lacunae]
MMSTSTDKPTVDHALQSVHTLSGLELVKAKDAIEQFIYSCSHTLRSPLKSIAGLVNILKSEQGNPEIDPAIFLSSIEKTVSKMESVLNELEQFLTNSRQSLTMHAVDAKTILDDVLHECRDAIQTANVRVTTSIKQPVALCTDGNRLHVMLAHVISNAIQFRDTAKARAEIHVNIKVMASVCLIRVRDNGVGMTDAVLPHIYELFYRGSVQSAGAGVGLYVVKEILNKIGGIITVRSEVGVGSAFLISVPNLVP